MFTYLLFIPLNMFLICLVLISGILQFVYSTYMYVNCLFHYSEKNAPCLFGTCITLVKYSFVYFRILKCMLIVCSTVL